MIQTEQLVIGYDENTIVENLDLTISDGKITALVGANGSGKSTILKAISRLLKTKQGTVYLDGKSIREQKSREIAKQLAILPQNPTAPDGLTVAELVSYGRFPHQKGFGKLTRHDRHMVHWAIEVTGMTEFANRPVDQLSGGQRQRAWIAMALAQETPTLLLDEPTTFLDMAHQLEVLYLLERLNKEQGYTIVMVIHDLNHASRFADHMVAIKQGKIIKTGSAKEVMTPAILEEAFGIRSEIIPDPHGGHPLCLPYGLCSEKHNKTQHFSKAANQ